MKSDLERYSSELPPSEYEYDELLDDVIMVEYIDTDAQGHVKRGSLFLPTDHSRAVWRVGKIVKVGTSVKPPLTVGKLVQFPNDKGMPAIINGGSVGIFLNADRILATVVVKEPNSEIVTPE